MIARIILSLTVAFSAGVRAQGKAVWQQKLSKHLQADFPYTKAAIRTQFPKNNVANKGMAIIVGREAFMCFDTDLLRWAAGWTGGYITEDGVSFKGNHGTSPRIAGEQKFGTSPIAGWADAKGSFADSRPEPFGPLPRKHVQWLGNYVANDQVVLSYKVHGVGILEQPGSIEKDGQTVFVRSIKYEDISADLVTMVCEVENAKGGMEDGVAILVAGDQVTQVALMNAPKGSVLEVQKNKRVVARLAKGTKSGTLQIHIWRGAKADLAQFAILAKASAKAEFRKEGKNRWPDPVVTQGVMNASKTPDGA